MTQELKDVRGQCLCGQIKFVLNGSVSSFHICYCSRCRHSTGSAHASNIFTTPDSITWFSGQHLIRRFELESAKSWSKQFCSVCGSGLPYINRAGTHLVVPAGCLDSELNIEPDDKIFCDAREKWVESIANKIEFAQLPERF